jgi:hypothetical protein
MLSFATLFKRGPESSRPRKGLELDVDELSAIFMTVVEHVATMHQSINIFVGALDEAGDGTEDQNTSHQI